MASCTKEGLLDVCEKQMDGLNKCKKSLNDFLDGRRRQFPRFYFMSEADLLDVLSNGSQPHKIICHTSKMFLAVKTLELDIGPEDTSRRPEVKKWISGIGSEFVMFNAVPVPKYNVPKGMPPLEGKAEIYLETVVEAMKSTLFLLFEGCLDSYEKLERSAWVMEGGSDPSRLTRTTVISSTTFCTAITSRTSSRLSHSYRLSTSSLSWRRAQTSPPCRRRSCQSRCAWGSIR